MAGTRLNSFANVGKMCREEIDPQHQLSAGGHWYRKVQWRYRRMACQPWPRSARRYRAALLSGVAGWGRLFSTYIRREWVAGVDVWRCPLWVPSEPSGTKRIIKKELLVRQAADSFAPWVIVRPTSIGPWFDMPVSYKSFRQ